MPKGHFDFNCNAWNTDSVARHARCAQAEPWKMPESGQWVACAKAVLFFEDRLWSRPWLLGLYILVLVGVWFCRFVLRVDEYSLGVFVACVVLPFLAIVTIYAIDANARSFNRAHRTLEDDKDPDVCPVVLTIFQNGLVTGEDAGVAWFEDSSLYFSGSGCSFAVGRRDLHPEAPWRMPAPPSCLVSDENCLFLRSTGQAIGIRLTPAYFADEFGELPEPGRRFVERKRDFKPAEGGPERSYYPPLSVSPALREDPLPFRHLVWLQLLALIYFALLSMMAGAPLWIGLGIATLCALSLPALRPRRNPKVVASG